MAPLFWDIPILWWPQYHPGRKDALALHWILTMTRNGWILHRTVGLRYPSILCSTPNEEEGAHLHQYVRHGCLWNLLVINPRFDNLFGRFSFVPTSPKFWGAWIFPINFQTIPHQFDHRPCSPGRVDRLTEPKLHLWDPGRGPQRLEISWRQE